jgi:predicted glycogen debranching enzyme
VDPIVIPKNVCQDLVKSIQKEWVETNSLGGYASSTVSLVNTRRYHSLLTAANKPPLERFVLLSSLEDALELDGEKFYLSCHFYPDTVYPRGHEYLTQFSLDPFPTFLYEIGATHVKKTIFLLHRENTVVIAYKLLETDASSVKLEVKPLAAFRDYHALTQENSALNPALELAKGQVKFHPYAGLAPLYFHHNAVIVDKAGYWYRNFEYVRELERGLDHHEDLFAPFALIYSFLAAEEVYLVASTQPLRSFDFEDAMARELERRRKIAATFPTKDRLWFYLWQSAESFVVERRGGEKAILAGYHWFGDWGRDTMISLHGLLLTRGQYEVAKSVLLSYSQYVNKGVIPNRFPDFGDTPEYNTIDASLWYVNAVYEYLEYTDDVESVERQLYPVLKKIVKFYREGTHYGIRMNANGLVQGGEGNVALTWMDARVRGVPVTPRHGQPVEINALWYNALCVVGTLAGRFGESKVREECEALAKKARESFNQLLWNEERGCLFDGISENGPDPSVRPNQIFALSLAFPVLDEKRWKDVLRVVEEELMTPYGLRTLSPKDPKYIPYYEGDPSKRDSAYHQGAVWPWLMGAFVAAYLRAYGSSKDVRTKVRRWLDPLLEHVEEEGLATISEIFDGDPPHMARGCISQAWSVAELLRSYELLKPEDVRLERPKELILR